jgi:hypothetical protein
MTESGRCYMNAAAADPTGPPDQDQFAVVDAGTEYIMAVVDTPIREGPGPEHLPAGLFYGGMTARVTGRTPDGAWWRVDCDVTQTSARECYVSADPAQTVPADAP